ncbi:hypothetical protein [Paraburkholderia heleia]|uniref:hypothetical protein n=1 Tax=Paraburkholderia heleia TaxID=634127 RepID=UPI0031D7E1C4
MRWVHDATGRTFHVRLRDGATTPPRREPLRIVREHIDRQRRFVLAQAVSATLIDRANARFVTVGSRICIAPEKAPPP